ncbi:RHS repeat domain-containing protein [Actinosynnema sp. CA-248983]
MALAVFLVAGLVSDQVSNGRRPDVIAERAVEHEDFPLSRSEKPAMPEAGVPAAVRWPAAGEAVATVDSARRMGDLPVTLAAKTRRAVKVRVVDHAVAESAGIAGVIVAVSPQDDATGDVSLELDYSGFAESGGASFGTRLRLVALPECVLTTPERSECRVRRPIRSDNDAVRKVVRADLALDESAPADRPHRFAGRAESAATVLAAVAGPEGSDGTFKATSLAASGTWSVGGNSGGFIWNYPISLPPAAAGERATPKVELTYNSSHVDGRTAAANGQSSWIGQGWEYSAGYVERSYRSCADDKSLPADQQTGDLCWAGDVVTMNLGGQSLPLVLDDATKTWRTAPDSGARVELVQGAVNGARNGEYWKLTSTDGVSYFFGRNRGAGYSNQEQTNSTWTVPVYGPRSTDPCFSTAGFAASKCDQAWRWNLDFVEDPYGNTAAYYYSPETNYYGANGQSTGVAYTRGGTLKRIDYGLRNTNNSIYGQTMPFRVLFDVTERCVPAGAITCDPSQFTSANATHWPDTPQDQACASNASCENHSPSFWSTKRLTSITTQYDKGQGPVTVDRYQLEQEFPSIGNKELWLKSIKRTAFQESTELSLPPVTFSGQLLDNRVRDYNSGPALVHWRITNIRTDSGTSINIDYSAPDCSATDVPSDLAHNTRRCYPVYWTKPFNPELTLDYFNKYVVTKVDVQDVNAISPTQSTRYSYVGAPAWHYDDNELVRPEHRTYGQFRGYGQVEVRTGDPASSYNGVADRQTLKRTTYYRGMDGDTMPNGGKRTATVQDSRGTSVPDSPEFAGGAREEQIFNGDTAVRVSSTITEQTLVRRTASRNRTGLPALTADIVGVASTTAITDLAAGGSRSLVTTQRYDDLGRVVAKTESGDGVPELCVTTRYADNTSTWIRNKVVESITSQQACPAPGEAQTSIVSAVRNYYDGQDSLGSLTGPGNATKTEVATAASGSSMTFATGGSETFDASGRRVSSTDAVGRVSGVTYTPADGGVLTKTVTTNPKGHTSTVEIEPARGKTTSQVDIAGRRTDATYDALGRLTATWKPGQTKGSTPPTEQYEYLMRTDGPLAVTTKKLVDHGAGTNQIVSIALYDGMGQLRQTQTAAPGGSRVVSDTFFDSHGWARFTNNRYLADGAPSTTLISVDEKSVPDRTVNEYDGAGRVTTATSYKGVTPTATTKTIHGGDRTTVIPPDSRLAATTIKDVRGRTTELRYYLGLPEIQGSTVSGGQFRTISYEHTADGMQTGVVDAAGNRWTSRYDLLGRKIGQIDPDAGTTSTTYDLAGQITSTTDARGQVLSYEYDVMGRKTFAYAGTGTTRRRIAAWTYDGANNGVGKPYVSTRYTPQGVFRTAVTTYDEQGLPGQVVTEIPTSVTGLGGQYTTTFAYTKTGLLTATEQPTVGGLPGESVSVTYDEFGKPQTTRGYNAYVSESSYTPYGEASQFTLGPSSNKAWLTFDYDEQTRKTTGVNFAVQAVDQQVDDTRLAYDAAGGLTKVVNTRGGAGAARRTECFGYDVLNQLTDAWTATDDCVARPSTDQSGPSAGPAVGGPEPYWLSWSFGVTGLRARQVSHAVAGATTGDTTTTYAYSASGHALTGSTTSSPGGTASTGFGYDSAGNTTTRTLPSGTQTLAWDEENRLKSVTGPGGTTSYVYDADGGQLVRRDPGTTTLFLPGQELTRNNTTGVVTGTRYYTHNGMTVAVRVGNSNPTYLVPGRHGTASVAVGSVGFAVTRRVFDPYGNPLGQVTGGGWPGSRGFLDKSVSENTGLVDVGARKYDCTTGRFLSVDPALDPANPLQLTGYGYGNNNPVAFEDHSGLMPFGNLFNNILGLLSALPIIDPGPVIALQRIFSSVFSRNRAQDNRRGARVVADDVSRNPKGGRNNWESTSAIGLDLDNDWAGRTILDWYLTGDGETRRIVDDLEWSEYMLAGEELRLGILQRFGPDAGAILRAYLDGNLSCGYYQYFARSKTDNISAGNGEGIIGYNYLNGVNEVAGGFEVRVSPTVTDRGDGTYELQLQGTYTFNDIVDPNYGYDSDKIKSKVADTISRGRAKPYNLHITWNAKSTVVMDRKGNVLSADGYPWN